MDGVSCKEEPKTPDVIICVALGVIYNGDIQVVYESRYCFEEVAAKNRHKVEGDQVPPVYGAEESTAAVGAVCQQQQQQQLVRCRHAFQYPRPAASDAASLAAGVPAEEHAVSSLGAFQ